MAAAPDSHHDTALRDRTPPLERIMAAVGAVLLAATLGYLGRAAVRDSDSPPAPRIEVLEIVPQATQQRFLVRLRVRNLGRQTAESLRVRGRLQADGGGVEEAETEFQYLPGRSAREAGIFFRHDPRAGRLEFAAESYQQP